MEQGGIMRYAARTDTNQDEIVKALRRLGFDVDIISQLKGCFDILVSGVPAWCNRSVGVRVEIKTDERATLTPAEEEYWEKQRCPDNLIRAHGVEDVLGWFGK